MPTSDSAKGTKVYDPVYVHASREAIVIVALFTAMLGWSLCVSIGMGYPADSDTIEVSRVMGLPAWVFWGILIPWLVVDLIAVWFCFFYMKDDDLGEVNDVMGEPAHEPRRNNPGKPN